ncbi:MAG: hypothetical protein K5754_05290, partial [Butyrivibrio sp.]|nr:hypothetical protein [Butyrivibrio sp.]
MKKKYLTSIMAFVMSFAVLYGCGDISLGKGEADTKEQEEEEDLEEESEDSEESEETTEGKEEEQAEG